MPGKRCDQRRRKLIMKEPRIISLIPSATEIIYASGLGKFIVGRTHLCDYPEPANELPVCSSPGNKATGSDEVKNRPEKEILEKSLSVFNIDIEKIRELNPTHIFTQSLFKSYELTAGEVQAFAGNYFNNQDIKIVDLNPRNLDHALADFVKISTSLGYFDAGYKLRISINNRIIPINSKANMLGLKPKVAVIEWIDPLIPVGLWMCDLIELASGKNVFQGQRAQPQVSFQDLLEQDPDKILFAPCGLDLVQTGKQLNKLVRNEGWQDLKAVKNGEVYLVDGKNYFNRPGPRMIDSLELLTEILHPESFECKHKDTGWIRYQTKA